MFSSDRSEVEERLLRGSFDRILLKVERVAFKGDSCQKDWEDGRLPERLHLPCWHRSDYAFVT